MSVELWWKTLCLVLAALLFAGCATHAERVRDIRGSFYSGDLDAAAEQLDRELSRSPRDTEVLLLQRAMVELFAGRPRDAEQSLRTVRDRLDFLEQQSLGEEATALLTDDNRRAYAGEDYEKVLLRAFLALSNLMHDGQDAAAYGWQLMEKQRELLADARPAPAGDRTGEHASSASVAPASATHESAAPEAAAAEALALGAYLQALLRERTHANYDEVARRRAEVVRWQPQFAFGPSDLERARHGRHSARGHGVLYVFGLVGRGPIKREAVEVPSTAALAIAEQILNQSTSYRLPPTLAPIKVPQVVRAPNRLRFLEVGIGGQPAGRTSTLTHIGRLAEAQSQAASPRVVARAVVRRVVKKGIVAAGRQRLNADDSGLANLAMDVAGVVWEATESADTRCWELLPDQIQVARFELPVGRHAVSLTPLSDTGPLGPAHATDVEILDGRDTYMLAFFPDSVPVGRILVGPAGR